MILTTTDGQTDLPRYFTQVFALAQNLHRGRLDMVLPDGRRFRVDGAPGFVAEVNILNPDLFARMIREGELGFCDAYLDGWWDTPDLQALMDLIHDGNEALYDSYPGQALVQMYERIRHWWRSNSKAQARRNISHHYDLGNDFYALWLDDTMTYSAAMFDTGQESLEAAQTAKYAALVDSLKVKPGDHVLEIGCGWGGFAEYAAGERGLKVTALTISQEQYTYAQERIAKAGLSEQVTFKLQDYRDETGTYDGVASIEMFEAVGEKYWPLYFNELRNKLKPNARASLQIITVADERFKFYRKSIDFIQKYIFPGGMLPGPTVLRQEIERAGLAVNGSVEFGEGYSQTLRRWHENFNEKWDQVATMGFDARFRRMWNFYLTSCAASFSGKVCDVTLVTVSRA